MSSENSVEALPDIKLPMEVFLDTSIHLARLRGDDWEAKVDGELAKFGFKGTGSYVKLEYGNQILTQAKYYLKELKRRGSLEKLADHINNNLIPTLSDHRRKSLWFFNLLRRHFNHPDDTERAVSSLRVLLHHGTAAVNDICDDVHDGGIGCNWATQDGPKWTNPYVSPGTKANCSLGQFFDEHRELFLKIKVAIDDLPDPPPKTRSRQSLESPWKTEQLSGFADLIGLACEDPTLLRKCKTCACLADAIIAVQSDGYKSMFTMDIGESTVLCRVLRQLHILLRNDLDAPIEYHDYRVPSP